jgi:hypothetical protein
MGKRRLSVTQLILLGCVVVGVVFVATYASILVGPHPPRQPGQLPPTPPGPQLAFDETKWPVDPEKPDASAIWEWQKEGRHVFWFENTGAVPVDVWLNNKNCKCTDVEIAPLPDEMQGKTKAERDTFADKTDLPWHSLKKDDTRAYTVPAHKAGGVRLSWKGNKQGKETLYAELRTDSGMAAGPLIRLDLSLDLVAPLQVTSEEGLQDRSFTTDVSVGALGPGDSRTVNLICLSSTRDSLAVKVKPPEDPCIRCGAPEALSKAECVKLAQEADRPVTCAYRVPMTVSERTEDGTQFDLGRFRRQVVVSSEPGIDPVTVVVTGIVHGDVAVGGSEDRELVDLGPFERHEGKTKDITLSTVNGKLELEVESTPDFLQAQLKEEKAEGLLGKTWTVTVTVPPDALAGPVPPYTAIILKTKGERPRRIRVPVIGTAYVR